MPREARWFIRTALLYLAVALGIGLVRAAQGVGLVPGRAASLWLPQLHFLTVEWITQLIFGVAFWLFARPMPDEWRPPVMWTAYGFLNGGLLLRLVGEPILLPASLRPWLLLVSAGLQWGASLLLAKYFWRRVRPK